MKNIKIPKYLIVAMSSWISKIFTAVIQLLNIRILLRYLDNENYAIYTVLISLVGWFNLSELGIGNSIQNFISEARAKEKDYSEKMNATLFMAISLIVIIIFLMFLIFVPLTNILFKNYETQLDNISIIVLIFGIAASLNSIFSISYKVFYGIQKGYISNIFTALGYLLAFLILFILDKNEIGKNRLFCSVLAYVIPQMLVSFISFINIFKTNISSFFKVNFKEIEEIFLRAYKFAGFQLFSNATLQVDYIIMINTLSAEEITNYNIISKIFAMIFFIYSAVLSAVWPTIAELFNKNMYKESEKIVKRYLFLGLGFVIICSIGFAVFKDLIIMIFSDNPERINIGLTSIVLFCIYYLLRVWTDTFSTMLQSLNILKIFWIYVPIQALVSCICQVIASRIYGINGIIIGLIMSFILTAAWVLPYKYFKIRRVN